MGALRTERCGEVAFDSQGVDKIDARERDLGHCGRPSVMKVANSGSDLARRSAEFRESGRAASSLGKLSIAIGAVLSVSAIPLVGELLELTNIWKTPYHPSLVLVLETTIILGISVILILAGLRTNAEGVPNRVLEAERKLREAIHQGTQGLAYDTLVRTTFALELRAYGTGPSADEANGRRALEFLSEFQVRSVSPSLCRELEVVATSRLEAAQSAAASLEAKRAIDAARQAHSYDASRTPTAYEAQRAMWDAERQTREEERRRERLNRFQGGGI